MISHVKFHTLLYIRPIYNEKEVRINVVFRVLPNHSKNNGGIRSTKKNFFFFFKNHWPRGPPENKLWWPELARQPQKGIRASGHIANVKACLFLSSLPCTMVFATVSFALTRCPNHLAFLFF